MTNLYLSKYNSGGKEFHTWHNSEHSLVEQMLDEEVLAAVVYNTESKTFSKVDPIVTNENKIWVAPGLPLAKNEGEIYVEIDEEAYIKNSDGLYVLVKKEENGEHYLSFTSEMETFREVYLNESDTPGAIETLAFVDLDEGIVQPLEITFEGFQFQITPVDL